MREREKVWWYSRWSNLFTYFFNIVVLPYTRVIHVTYLDITSTLHRLTINSNSLLTIHSSTSSFHQFISPPSATSTHLEKKKNFSQEIFLPLLHLLYPFLPPPNPVLQLTEALPSISFNQSQNYFFLFTNVFNPWKLSSVGAGLVIQTFYFNSWH